MKTAVVTIAHGRHAHLRRQIHGLRTGTVAPDVHVVVAMADADIAALVAEEGSSATVVPCPGDSPLPLARARNLGAATALKQDCELLVFLDVDCIPGARLIQRYRTAASAPDHAAALLCGPVTYLDPPPETGYEIATLDQLTAPHPGRPCPPDDAVVTTTEYALFWSLSFAVTRSTWTTIGGFDERYRGYGGEDTDYGCRAASQGVPMRWVGGAHAFHQHHPVEDPPVRHLDDILRNARQFHHIWGWWPMQGWFDAFETMGLIRRLGDGTPIKT